MAKSLQSISTRKFFIVGDFNIDLLAPVCDTNVCRYTETLFSYLAIPLITQPTRVTPTSSTLIDHIYSNATNLAMASYIIQTDLTDHFPIMCVMKKVKLAPKKHEIYYKRDFSSFNISYFRHKCLHNSELRSTNTDINTENFDILFENTVQSISALINKHAPLRPLTRRE